MGDPHDQGEVRDLHAGQDFIYNDNSSMADEPKHQERYYRLIIIHIISLAITCMLLIINIVQNGNNEDLLRDQRQDLVRYLNSAEANILSRMDANFREINRELQQESPQIKENTTE